jgi:enoyl-CoA hydratase/carnithine racemase
MCAVVRYEVTERIARIALDRPKRGNGITRQLIAELVQCVERADLDPAVHVLVLSGAGPGFCGGYDLVESAEGAGVGRSTDRSEAAGPDTQRVAGSGLDAAASAPSGSPLDPAAIAANHDPRATWDPMVDYAMMSRNVEGFMSLVRCGKPVVCMVHGFCVAGGTDMALCSDLLVIAADAKIGYPPARVWGRELQRVFPSRPFNVRFWDGGAVGATAATTRPRSSCGALRRSRTCFARPARLASAAHTSTARSPWTTSTAASRGRHVGAAAVAQRRSRAAGLRRSSAALPGGMPHRPSLELLLRGELHSAERDAAAVRYHYDVGNDFFALFLDESMTYSCAIFSRGAQTLEEAQRKARAGRGQARLKPGMRGARCRLRLGQLRDPRGPRIRRDGHRHDALGAQAELAREKRRAKRVSADEVEIRVQDYRQLPRSSFDAIASIGMSEHVGESQIDLYARTLFTLLRPGGTAAEPCDRGARSRTRTARGPLLDALRVPRR